jgi:hypothetical protein
MKIFVSHSSNYDYNKQLYVPFLEVVENSNHNVFLPEIDRDNIIKTKDIIMKSDLFIVECSRPSIGLGIECGWAEAFNVPIVAIYEQSFKLSGSIKFITDKIYSYCNKNELKQLLKTIIKSFEK